jgi:hypothetical protein
MTGSATHLPKEWNAMERFRGNIISILMVMSCTLKQIFLLTVKMNRIITAPFSIHLHRKQCMITTWCIQTEKNTQLTFDYVKPIGEDAQLELGL